MTTGHYPVSTARPSPLPRSGARVQRVRRVSRPKGDVVVALQPELGKCRDVGRWGETFGDDVVAAAMIDRLVHHSEVLTLSGDSYRTHGRRDLISKDTRADKN